eukprot:Skav223304  [mRNA]  locus=scaffold4198:269635:276127:- [translate_table: standard]
MRHSRFLQAPTSPQERLGLGHFHDLPGLLHHEVELGVLFGSLQLARSGLSAAGATGATGAGQYLITVTGFDACSLQPTSGASGEYAGLLVIKKYLEAQGQGIPHGGGGPGLGPICVKKHLATHLPSHVVVEPSSKGPDPCGTVSAAPWGQAGIAAIPWMFCTMLGKQGVLDSARPPPFMLHGGFVARLT